MRFPHYVRIRRQTGSTVNRDTGDVTPSYSVRYLGPADIQDEGAVLSRRVEAGEEIRSSEATIFLPFHADMGGIEPEDVIDFMWGTQPPADLEAGPWDGDAEVVRAVRLDAKLFVKGL